MARTEIEIIKFIRLVLEEHNDYWSGKISELKKYKEAYSGTFWKNQNSSNEMIRIETADAHAYIEGFIASLFTKAPAVEVGPDIYTDSNSEIAKAVSNRFLYNQRKHFEDASRQALIFNSSFLKLSARESNSILDRVSIKACPCWEIIVDRDANDWESQRFVGHNYYITIPDAKERFGNKNYTAIQKKDYFGASEKIVKNNLAHAELPEDYLYIEVVEIYDLVNDELYFWSPNYSNGTKLLDKEVIPVRTYDDRPLPPISPLYYSRIPDRPLEGMSTMSRIYDQVYEKNIIRTYWANSVRRDSRQYLYKKGAIDEEELAKVTAGIDGAMIGVDAESLEGIISEVRNTPISSNFDRYLAQVEQDINRGSIMAPFTRGEATNATATEITALSQYTASEIGKMARDRDEAIELTALIYIRILSLMINEGEKAIININGKASVVTVNDLEGKFRITALDQGSQPLSDAIRKQNIIQLIPILTQVGVPLDKIREEVIRSWDLPESFLETEVEKAERIKMVDDAKEAAKEAAKTKIGPTSIPDADEIEAGPEVQVNRTQNLADALSGSAQTV